MAAASGMGINYDGPVNLTGTQSQQVFFKRGQSRKMWVYFGGRGKLPWLVPKVPEGAAYLGITVNFRKEDWCQNKSHGLSVTQSDRQGVVRTPSVQLSLLANMARICPALREHYFAMFEQAAGVRVSRSQAWGEMLLNQATQVHDLSPAPEVTSIIIGLITAVATWEAIDEIPK